MMIFIWSEFVYIIAELCKFPLKFVLKIISACILTILSESAVKQGKNIKLYIVISSDKCIYSYFVHAHSTMTTAKALFNNFKKYSKVCLKCQTLLKEHNFVA